MTVSILRRYAFFMTALLFLGTTTGFGQDTDQPTAMPHATTPTAFDNPELVQHYQATITPEDLASHLFVFASDYFEGRETATRGQKLAATYLATQYRKMGVAPKGTAQADHRFAPEAYLQPFDLHGRRLESATVEVNVNGETVASSVFSSSENSGHTYLSFGTMPEIEGGVVFAGYGIADDELGYNDYAALEEQGLDFGGKWLLILRDEPLAGEDESLLSTTDGKPSRWTTNGFTKLRVIFNRGTMPAGILIVGDVGPRAVDVAAEAAQRASHLKEDVGNLSLEEQQGSRRRFPPMYTISTELADKILASTGRNIAELKQEIDENLTPAVFEVADVTVKSTIEQEAFVTSSENVAAFIEGSDPDLKDEVVVISSHYDHVGVNEGADGDQIFNGADDDGSGTVTVLEIAEAFIKAKQDGNGPRRSILFLNVAGEEKGLLGSAYYTDHEPILPLENTVTNLNIDMIGRYDPTHPGEDNFYVYIIGSKLISEELHEINQRVNEITDINLDLNERFNSKDDPNRFYARSDHWNFGKNNIPFIFFFTGTHEDYHGVDDEPDKVEYDRMARIGQLIFATAWQVANQDERPTVSGTGFN
ncbi:MAG: M28 family peptidase [Rhodothermales bacterium]